MIVYDLMYDNNDIIEYVKMISYCSMIRCYTAKYDIIFDFDDFACNIIYDVVC